MNLAEIISKNLIFIISLILLLILCLSNSSFGKQRTKILIFVIIITIFSIIFDSIDIYFSYSKWEYAYIIRNISCFFIFSLCPIIPCCLTAITKNNFKKSFKLILLFVNFILCIVNLFTGFMFNISPENIYTRKLLYVLPVLISLFFLIELVNSYIRDFKSIQKAEIIFIIPCAFMTLVVLGIQIIYGIPFLLTSYVTIAIIFYYLFLNIQILRIDSLTITLNRNMFEKECQTQHNKEKGVILVFDLNNLKDINDEFGHTKGDKFIVYTVNLIKRHFDDIGVVYRIGGDEFAVICKDINIEDIQRPVSEFQATLSLTNYKVAVGYAEYNNAIKKRDAFKKADNAMYKNKFLLKSLIKR